MDCWFVGGLVFVGDRWVFFFFFFPCFVGGFCLGGVCVMVGWCCCLAGVCGGGGCYLTRYVWLWLWLMVEVVVVGDV